MSPLLETAQAKALLFFIRWLRVNRDPIDLLELFFHAVFQSGGYIVDLRDG